MTAEQEKIMDKTPANGGNFFDPFGIYKMNISMFNMGMRMVNPFWPFK